MLLSLSLLSFSLSLLSSGLGLGFGSLLSLLSFTGFKLRPSGEYLSLTFMSILYNSLPSDDIVNSEEPLETPVKVISLVSLFKLIVATLLLVILKWILLPFVRYSLGI